MEKPLGLSLVHAWVTMMLNPRVLAVRIITAVVSQGKSLSGLFEQWLPDSLESRDRRLVQELSNGVIRWYRCLTEVCSYLLKKPLHNNDRDVQVLLLVGLYQLIYTKTAAYVAVNEAAKAAKMLKKNWAVAVVNGVLRCFQRQSVVLLKRLPTSLQYAHPDWLVACLQRAWPDQWSAILEANNQAPTLSLRLPSRSARDKYLEKLSAVPIAASASPISEVGILLGESCSFDQLPEFSTSKVFVQDIAAQLAVPLLGLQPKQRVLDACTAPGGKLTQLLEAEPHLACCIAIDHDGARLQKVSTNLRRLGLAPEALQLMTIDVESWVKTWREEGFDRILLDVPCSGTGVIRRHPDIKLRRLEQDVVQLAKKQLELLSALWSLLKPKGVLLYVTCSVLPQENQAVVEQFLAKQGDAKEVKIDADWGHACTVGRQMLPQPQGTDGFYYARLVKI